MIREFEKWIEVTEPECELTHRMSLSNIMRHTQQMGSDHIAREGITYERMQHDMDLNAGRIILGEKSIEEVGEEAFDLLLKVLSGQMTKNEALCYFGSMDIFCLGPVI